MVSDSLLQQLPSGLYIDGKWRDADGGAAFGVEDPATGEVLTHVADASPADAQAALDAAIATQTEWASTAPRRRSDILRDAFDLVGEQAEDLALLVTLEMGKPLSQARGEVTYGADFLRWYADEAVRISGRWMSAPDGRSTLVTMRMPVGPTLMITPWNFPLAMLTRKIAPAIAAGCTMVLKPAEQTPLTALALVRIFEQVGLPAGVLNLVTTAAPEAVVGPLFTSTGLRKVTFTGSTEVGRTLVAQSARRLLRVSMELGGNAPFIVCADADMELAVDGAMVAKMRNMGEACTAANRFYVHESRIEEFSGRLAERMSAEVLGHGTDPSTTVGPLIDAAGRAKVASMVADCVAGGAEVTLGGSAVDGAGYFFEPTVVTGVPSDARVFREEIFGPVAPIASFRELDEVIARANDTDYGLVAYAMTESFESATALMHGLEYGMVAINQGLISNAAAPFGGVKQSGLGREGGAEGIDDYLSLKYVGMPAPRR